MKLKNIGYAALMALATTAFVLGSAGSSEAAKKKAKAKAAAAPVTTICWGVSKPVCATRGGLKFTYANACYAVRDGAKVTSDKACPAKKAVKAKKKAPKKMAKPAMKKEMKKK